MKPLNPRWIMRYKAQDNVLDSALRGYDWKRNWLGAWRLMRDFQDTQVTGD